MLYSLPATSATLAILSIWFWRPSSRHFSKVKVCLGLIGNPNSSESSSQWRLLMPGLRNPWISGMYGLKSSICDLTSVATYWTATGGDNSHFICDNLGDMKSLHVITGKEDNAKPRISFWQIMILWVSRSNASNLHALRKWHLSISSNVWDDSYCVFIHILRGEDTRMELEKNIQGTHYTE